MRKETNRSSSLFLSLHPHPREPELYHAHRFFHRLGAFRQRRLTRVRRLLQALLGSEVRLSRSRRVIVLTLDEFMLVSHQMPSRKNFEISQSLMSFEKPERCVPSRRCTMKPSGTPSGRRVASQAGVEDYSGNLQESLYLLLGSGIHPVLRSPLRE
mgnify:CR=1 FL=1